MVLIDFGVILFCSIQVLPATPLQSISTTPLLILFSYRGTPIYILTLEGRHTVTKTVIPSSFRPVFDTGRLAASLSALQRQEVHSSKLIAVVNHTGRFCLLLFF